MSDLPYRNGPHTEGCRLVSDLKLSPAKLRERKMRECNCRLCYLCLNPNSIYFDWDKLHHEQVASGVIYSKY